ncbi:MAG TPA: DUF4136 domain-containing protein [Candidatus Dormibacteraeota bacterium]|nr:DUF4136 domain-containing protein [Candidatus Dormibacteraeota bacterium]
MSQIPIRAAVLVPAVAGLLAGCYSLTVRTDVNSALAGTVHCSSYAWAGSFRGNSTLRSTVANPINESRLRSAIAAHLGGGVQDDASKADCLVGYGIGSTQVIDGGWGYPYYGWGGPWGPDYWGPGYWGPYVYREGVIAIDVYEAKSRQPLWHASVDQSLYGVSGPEAQKRIDAAVAAIFAKHPA